MTLRLNDWSCYVSKLWVRKLNCKVTFYTYYIFRNQQTQKADNNTRYAVFNYIKLVFFSGSSRLSLRFVCKLLIRSIVRKKAGTTEIITDEIANPNDHDRLYCTVLPLPAAQHSIPQIPDITKK